MFSSSFNCRRYTLLPPPSSNDNQLHIQSIWFDLSYESNFFPHENSVIFRFSRQRIVGEKLPRNMDNDFERYSTLDESKRFSIESSIITFPHWTNVREREKERGKKKKGEGGRGEKNGHKSKLIWFHGSNESSGTWGRDCAKIQLRL